MARERTRLGLALTLALAASGCRFGEVSSRNLDEVMGPGDRFRYAGRVTSTYEYILEGFVDPSMLADDSLLNQDSVDPIRDPTDLALESLLDLAASDDGPRAWREAEEVRHFARYAVACPSALCRERALLELAPHATRLAIGRPAPPPEPAANAAELSVALSGLVDTARALVDAGGGADETVLTDFEAACELLAASDVDVSGGRRVLRGVAPFLRSSALHPRARASLEALSAALQERLVAQALWLGLRDRDAIVRAAAGRSTYAAMGEAYLLEAVFALVPRGTLPEGIRAEHATLRLPVEPPDVSTVHRSVLTLLAERGMPSAASGGEVEALELRFVFLRALLQLAVNHDVYVGGIRTHAMLALHELTGALPGVLREEEWDAWWAETGRELSDRVRAAREVDAEG